MDKNQTKKIIFICIIAILCILNIFTNFVPLRYMLLLCSGLFLGYYWNDGKKNKNTQENLKVGNVSLTGERYKIIMEVIQILAIEENKSKQPIKKK
jgi:hypothetical protein